MIRSMTGFGDAERDLPSGRVRVEIRSVNHRFFNGTVRLPQGLDRHESLVLQRIKRAVSRGSVTFSLTVDRSSAAAQDAPLPGLDLERARAYAEALRTLASELGLSGEPDVATFARFSDVFRAGEARPRWADLVPEVIEELTDEALAGLVAARDKEGARLRDDFLQRLERIGALVEAVDALAPERLVRERDRLRDAIAELTESTTVDEDRLAREIAYLADKWDVSEEVVRLRSHSTAFREALDQPTSQPVGKRLGFVLQEMNREANTIGSKANDAEIARHAVGLKEEIERMREQIENVE